MPPDTPNTNTRITTIALAIIIQYGKVLLVQKDSSEWRFPEASPMPDKNLFESLETKVQQTLGLDVVTQEVFFEHQDTLHHYSGIFALPMDDEIITLNGYSAAEWIDIDDLSSQACYHAHLPLFQQLQQNYS